MLAGLVLPPRRSRSSSFPSVPQPQPGIRLPLTWPNSARWQSATGLPAAGRLEQQLSGRQAPHRRRRQRFSRPVPSAWRPCSAVFESHGGARERDVRDCGHRHRHASRALPTSCRDGCRPQQPLPSGCGSAATDRAVSGSLLNAGRDNCRDNPADNRAPKSNRVVYIAFLPR